MADAEQLPPDAQILQALFGFMVTRSLSAVAELDVADALATGPLSCGELASAVGAAERPLYRVMRLLVSIGMFSEPEPGTFSLTPVSDLLRSDHPNSMRDLAVVLTSESHWLPWGRFTVTAVLLGFSARYQDMPSRIHQALDEASEADGREGVPLWTAGRTPGLDESSQDLRG